MTAKNGCKVPDDPTALRLHGSDQYWEEVEKKYSSVGYTDAVLNLVLDLVLWQEAAV